MTTIRGGSTLRGLEERQSKMASDDLSYVCLLAFSICFGPVLKRTVGYRNKQLLSSGIGLIIVVLWCRRNVLHSLVAAFINSLIIKFLSPK